MNVFIDKFGAIGDGIFDCSLPIKQAIEEVKNAGGGKIIVKKGVWKTGPIDLYSNIEFHLKKGAVISFIPQPELYPPVFTRWEGVECWCMHPCVFADKQENIIISGKGTFDGSGQWWWEQRREKKAHQKTPVTEIEKKFAALNPEFMTQPGGGGGRETQFLRPPLVQFLNCKNIKLEGITLANSPFWTMHPVYCDGLEMIKMTVKNPHDAPNTDGIDIDSCQNVKVINCIVAVGDDGIALKSGSGSDGIKVNKPCRNVLVKGCTVGDGHGGIVIGSETAAGVDHLVAENCKFIGTDRGIRIKTRRGRGGDIHHLEFKNLKMKANLCPFALNMYYKCGAKPEDEFFSLEKLPVTSETPRVHDVSISGIKAKDCKASAGLIIGLPECPIENLEIKNSSFSTDENSTISPQESDMFFGIPPVDVKSFRIKYAKDPKFSNCKISGPKDVFIYE